VLLCAGTFLIGSAIIPWTWQEPLPQNVLSIGCMLEMWLLSIGFSTTYAALYTRTWRVREVLTRADAFQRSTVTARDVMWGPVALIFLNAVLLIIWHIVDPVEWTRVVTSRDYFGRPVESYGTCFEFENHGTALIFLLLLASINLFLILVTAVQAQRSRFLPSQYNERNHLAIASFLMLEVALLGIPILLASGTRDPAALMVVGSWIFAISAFAVLLPMFVPKIGVEHGWIEDKNPMHGPEFQESLSKSMRRLGKSRRSTLNNNTGNLVQDCGNETSAEASPSIHRRSSLSGSFSRSFKVPNMFKLGSAELPQT
jgi:gamma-aminobutyric acid type B receptor